MSPCHSVIARRSLTLAALFAASIGLAAPAHARVFVGVGVPFGPFWAPPPVYYPPPAYYPPPPVYYAPPPAPAYAPGYSQTYNGQMCMAPPTNCPMERASAPGTSCYCTDGNGQRIWGRAN